MSYYDITRYFYIVSDTSICIVLCVHKTLLTYLARDTCRDHNTQILVGVSEDNRKLILNCHHRLLILSRIIPSLHIYIHDSELRKVFMWT